MQKTVKKFKWFTIADYEKEEAYLTEMNKKGYRLKEISWSVIFTFDVTEPEEIVYRLDVKDPNDTDYNQYLLLFQDSGWEHIFDVMGWSYFRKSNLKKQTEIYSDDESRMELVKKIFYTRLLPLLLLFTIIVIPSVYDILRDNFSSVESQLSKFVSIFTLTVYVIYIIIVAYSGYGLFQLTRKYSKKYQ